MINKIKDFLESGWKNILSKTLAFVITVAVIVGVLWLVKFFGCVLFCG